VGSPIAGRDSPYQGLRAFGEEDTDFFFGRTRDIRLVVANLFAAPLTVLYGPSGVGKTSVLHAGVLPALRSRGIVPTVFDSWPGDALDGLPSAVEAMTAEPEPGTAPKRTVLVLDQFEDYFLDPVGDDSFATELARLVVDPRRSSSVLLTVREDALAKLDRFEARIPSLLDNVLRLDQLDRDAAREAIEGPRDAWNERAEPSARLELEEQLVGAVLDSVTAPSGRIEAALLQLVLQRLWEERDGPGPYLLRRSDFEELGGLEGIVERHVTGTLDGLPPEEQELAAAIFEHLVTPSRLRIAQRSVDLAGFAGVEEDELLPLLEELSSDRVLRPVSGHGDSRYEVIHESLADAVLGWRTGYVTAREVAAEQERARRRFRRVLVFAVLATVVSVAMAALAAYAWTQRQTARSEALSSEALRLLDVDPAEGVRKALEAVEVRSLAQAENALRAALARSHERAVLDDFGGAPVTSVDVGPAGTLLMTDDRGSLTLRTESGDPVRPLPEVRGANDAVFCPDAGRIAVATDDGALLLAGRRSIRLRRDGVGTRGISCSRDGSRIATVAEDAFRVYSASGDELRSIEASPLLEHAAVSPDGSLLVVAGIGGARLVRISDGRQVGALEVGLSSVAFSRDGSRVVAGGTNGDVLIWRPGRSGEPQVLRGHEQLVRDVAFSRDGSLVVSASADRTARVWDATSGDELAALRGHGSIVESADVSPDRRTVATASKDGTVRLWQTPVQVVLRGHRQPVVAVAISADGRRVATAAEDVRLWNAGSGRTLARLPAREVREVAISADGSRILTVHQADGRARVWGPGRPRATVLAVPGDPILSAAFVPGESTVVAATLNGAIAFFDPSGRIERRLRAPESIMIGKIAISSDGDRVAVAAAPEGFVAILDAESGDELARLADPALQIRALAFDPEGGRLLTGEFGGVARVWETGDGELASPALEGHVGPLDTVSFDHDAELVVTAGIDETVRIWHVATATELATLRGGSAAFASATPTLVVAGPGPTARIFRCTACGPVSELRGRADPEG
jgi:WD40 repeat protein